MGKITCPYCNKTYFVRRKLLMRLGLAPQIGNRNTEMRPKLEATDPSDQKWVEILPKIKGVIHELRLRPKKLPYRLHPIIRLMPNGSTTMEETDGRADDEARHRNRRNTEKDQPNPKGRGRKTQTPKNQTPQIDFLQVPTRTDQKGESKAGEERPTQDTPKNNQTKGGEQKAASGSQAEIHRESESERERECR